MLVKCLCRLRTRDGRFIKKPCAEGLMRFFSYGDGHVHLPRAKVPSQLANIASSILQRQPQAGPETQEFRGEPGDLTPRFMRF